MQSLAIEINVSSRSILVLLYNTCRLKFGVLKKQEALYHHIKYGINRANLNLLFSCSVCVFVCVCECVSSVCILYIIYFLFILAVLSTIYLIYGIPLITLYLHIYMVYICRNSHTTR